MAKPQHNQPLDTIAADLLQEALMDASSASRVLSYTASMPALAPLIPRAQQVIVASPGVIAREQLRQALPQAGNLAFLEDVALPGTRFGTFDLVVIEQPQSRALARRWLVEAHAGLRDAGVLYLAGANDSGIRSGAEDAAALFGGAHTLLSKRRGRVVRARKQASAARPEWAGEPGIALGSWHRFSADLGSGVQAIESLPGVFSYDRLDVATGLLLSKIDDVRGKRVLDIGCGAGVIGLALSQRGAASVDMLDENRYAVAAARRNAETYGLRHVRVEAADVRSTTFGGPYDLVVTNPPFHRGKQIDYSTPNAFIAHARKVLVPGGHLVLVANSFIRYDMPMREQFGAVEPIAQTPGFTLWQATNLNGMPL